MSSGVYFTEEELKPLSVQNLRNVLEYLDVPMKDKHSKEKLILMILERQKELQPYFADESTPETPKYSVRVKRIMEAKAKGELL